MHRAHNVGATVVLPCSVQLCAGAVKSVTFVCVTVKPCPCATWLGGTALRQPPQVGRLHSSDLVAEGWKALQQHPDMQTPHYFQRCVVIVPDALQSNVVVCFCHNDSFPSLASAASSSCTWLLHAHGCSLLLCFASQLLVPAKQYYANRLSCRSGRLPELACSCQLQLCCDCSHLDECLDGRAVFRRAVASGGGAHVGPMQLYMCRRLCAVFSMDTVLGPVVIAWFPDCLAAAVRLLDPMHPFPEIVDRAVAAQWCGSCHN